MSVRCISQVLDSSGHAGTELLMLLVLADYSDDNGNSYPSVAALAQKCRMKPRNANYILSALEASGELQILKNEGPKGTNRYRIMLANLRGNPLQCSAPLQEPAPLQDVAPLQGSAPLQCAAPTPAMECAKPLHPIAAEPSLNRQEPSKGARKRAAAAQLISLDDLIGEGVDPQCARDWLAVRRSKKLPLTPTAWSDTKSEASLAGLSVASAVKTAAANGWGGFKAQWLKSDRKGGRLDCDDIFAGAL